MITNVIFYGVSTWVKNNYEEINQKYSPVAFVDGNLQKQGTKLFETPIISLEQALEKHPDASYYISVQTPAFVEQIFNMLVEKGIPQDKIAYPDEIQISNSLKKCKSCRSIEHSIIWMANTLVEQEHDCLQFCCGVEGYPSPDIAIKGDDIQTAILQLEKLRENILQDIDSSSCKSCPSLTEMYYPKKRTVTSLGIVQDDICNFQCCYCERTSTNTTSDQKVDSAKRSIRFIEKLEEIGIISPDHTSILISGASEISISKSRDIMLDAIKHYPVILPTNATVFSDKIADLSKNPNSRIIVSMDSGTKQTFAKVKGVDAFEKVCGNLKSYFHANASLVLKYIVLPGVNDNMKDVDGFLDICSEIEVRHIEIVRNFWGKEEFSENTISVIRYMLTQLKERNINVDCSELKLGAILEPELEVVT
ncbi:MAG: hypothetical protein FWF76_01750 [Oscillospiraceae bacterium]|nr:hypothetical protein [Oscillospiraceae bacterium]